MRDRLDPASESRLRFRQSCTRAAPDRVPHQEAEIEGAGVDDEPLEDVLMAAQVGAAETAGVIEMRKRPLDVLAAPPHQPLPASAAHPTPIAIDGPLRLGCLRPAPPPAIGFGEVGADADGLEREQRLVAVVSLVADEIPRGRGL